MTVELSRRWFLIGSAAAIAAAQIPVGAPLAQPVQALVPYKLRKICGLDCFFNEDAGLTQAVVSLSRLGPAALDTPILQFQMNTHQILRWAAFQGDEIIVNERNAIVLDLRSPTGFGKIILTCVDYDDEAMRTGIGRMLQETHTFPNRGPAEIVYFDAANA